MSCNDVVNSDRFFQFRAINMAAEPRVVLASTKTASIKRYL